MNSSQRETWRAWKPLDDTPETVIFHALRDDHEGFRILLDGEFSGERAEQMIRVRFERVFAYRNVDEGYRLEEINSADEHSPFWMVEDSDFLRWFHKSSLNIYEDFGIKHYVFATEDDVIDVLTDVAPVVEWFSSYCSA